MSFIIERAFELALQFHWEQSRKASIVPNAAYMGHLTEVAGMTWGCFAVGDLTAETVVASALLHDAIEDCHDAQESPRDRILEECGVDVLDLVLELTEQGVEGPVKYVEEVKIVRGSGIRTISRAVTALGTVEVERYGRRRVEYGTASCNGWTVVVVRDGNSWRAIDRKEK